MDETTLTALAAKPPRSRIKFPTVALARAELRRLGIENPGTSNIVALNQMIVAMSGAVSSPASPTPTDTPSPSLGFAELCELHTMIFGSSKTDGTLQNSSNWQFGGERIAACRNAGASMAQRRAVMAQIAAERAGTQDDQRIRLISNFARAGIALPGVSYSGIDLSNVRENEKFTPAQKAVAERDIHQFLGCLAGDSRAMTAGGAALVAAQKFINAKRKV